MSAKAAALLFVFLATLLVHAAAKRGEFVFFDDDRFVVDNPHIDRIGDPLRFFTDPSTATTPAKPAPDIYRPVRTLSYAVIAELWGKTDPSAYHTVAIVLHALGALLLAALLLAAGFAALPAAVGALCWGLHPLTVEVTAWVCSLGDAWCGVFTLASVLLYAKDRFVLAVLALLAALFSKEHAVVVPGLWLAWDYFVRRDRLRARPALVSAGVGAAVVIGFLVFRGSLGVGMSQTPEPLGGSHGQAVYLMLSGLGWYAGTILLPHGPTFQARVEASPLAALLGVCVLAALVWALLRGPRRVRLAAAWFLIALVPVSNVIVPLKIPTADRFLYLPLMGLAFVPAHAVDRWPRPAAWGATVSLVLLALLTRERIGDWRDSRSLVQAGWRVEKKSHLLVWQEAAQKAKDAIAAMQREDFPLAERLVNEAQDEYYRYLINSRPQESIQVLMELGELYYKWGKWMERLDHRPQMVAAYGRALETFARAHRLQMRGEGRVIDEEVRMAATRAAQLAVRLAEPENPELSATVKFGLEMLTFLEQRYQEDIALRSSQLMIVYASEIRVSRAREAREGLDLVLKKLGGRTEQTAEVKFLRAQALLYRGIIPPYSRSDEERAHALFSQAAAERRDIALQATFYSARACCIIAKLFNDEEMARKGQTILASIPELSKQLKIRVTEYLSRQMKAEKGTCVASHRR